MFSCKAEELSTGAILNDTTKDLCMSWKNQSQIKLPSSLQKTWATNNSNGN